MFPTVLSEICYHNFWEIRTIFKSIESKSQYQADPQTIKCQFCPHIETSQLICIANQLTGFYMRATLALNELNLFYKKQSEVYLAC